MTTWEQIPGSDHPDQRGEVAFPFYAEVGPEGDTTWSWTLLRVNADGTTSELTGSGPSAHADSEELAKALAEAAGLGALAQFETTEDAVPSPAWLASRIRAIAQDIREGSGELTVLEALDALADSIRNEPGQGDAGELARLAMAANPDWAFIVRGDASILARADIETTGPKTGDMT